MAGHGGRRMEVRRQEEARKRRRGSKNDDEPHKTHPHTHTDTQTHTHRPPPSPSSACRPRRELHQRGTGAAGKLGNKSAAPRLRCRNTNTHVTLCASPPRWGAAYRSNDDDAPAGPGVMRFAAAPPYLRSRPPCHPHSVALPPLRPRHPRRVAQLAGARAQVPRGLRRRHHHGFHRGSPRRCRCSRCRPAPS